MLTNLKKCLCVVICFVVILLILLQFLLNGKGEDNSKKIIIWWTPFIGDIEYTRKCGNTHCLFTENRQFLDHSKFKAVLFYGSNFNKTDLPIPRLPHHLWTLFHEESPKNVPLLMYDVSLRLFNATATFSRNSDFPLTLQYLDDYETLISRKYTCTVEEKNRLQQEELLAPVLYMQSICNTMSGRDQYLMELMQYINVDSYGKCLNNKELPESLSGNNYLSTIDSEELYEFISRYKFIISYENSVCNDYMTEKIWRTLLVGSVPVYFGAPNIKQWLPNNKSTILVDDFKGPKQLAEFLLNLNENDNEYNAYLGHKRINPIVTNHNLLNELATRQYQTKSVIEDFECFVCEHHFANQFKKGFECGEQLAFPDRDEHDFTETNWQSFVTQGKCEAETLHYFMTKNVPYNDKDFTSELMRRYDRGICKI